MPRHRIVLGMLLVVLVVLVFAGLPATAEAATDCTNCHGTKIADFVNPAVQPVDRNTACGTCHLKGTHQYQVELPQGRFQSADSLNTPIPTLHTIHAGNSLRWMSKDPYCGTCHADAKCNTCHTNVPHQSHSKTVYTPDSSFYVADSVYRAPNDLSCATSQCHGQLPNIKRDITNPDGTRTQLCRNCHETDRTGHPAHDLPVAADGSPAFLANPPVNCQNCHEKEIVTEHKANVLHQIGVPGQSLCVKCHGNSAFATIIMVDTVYNPTMCGSCHTDKVTDIFSGKHLPLHQATDTQSTSYAVAPLHSDNCNKCHANSALSGSIKTMAFGNTTGYTCSDCHAAGKAPEPKHKAIEDKALTTDFHPACNTCHDPAKLDVRNKIGQLAAGASYSCFDCHAGSPLAGKPVHTAGNDIGGANGAVENITGYHPGCNTCHNQQVKAKVSELKALPGYKCSNCHNSQTGVAGVPDHQAQMDAASPMISVPTYHANCQTCHGNAKVANNIQGLKGQSGYQCGNCHNGTDAKQPAHVSKAVSTGVDYNTTTLHPTCDTCHTKTAAKPVISSLVGQSGYLCTQCHSGVAAPSPKHSAVSETGGAAMNTEGFHPSCDTCHNDPGAKAKITAVRGTSGYLCATCHDGTVAKTPFHLAKLDANGTDMDTKGFHPSCNTCHGKPEVDGKIRTLKGTSGYLCSECHGTVAPAANHNAKTYSGGVSYVTTDVHNGCNKCHGKPAVDAKIKTLVNTSGYLCTDCHNNTVTTAPKHLAKADATGTDRDTTKLHPTCDTCHNTPGAVPTIMSLRGTSGYLCAQCHDGTIAGKPGHQAKLNATDTQTAEIVGFHPASCETCHANSNVSATIGTLKGTTGYLCSQCHDGTQAKQPVHQAKFKPTDASALVTVDFHPAGCSTCHNTTVSPKVAVAAGSANGYECGLCHDNSVAGKPSHSAKLDATSTPSDTTNVHPACNTCHGNTNSRIANLQTIYADLKAKVKAGQITTYQCSDCHGDVTARHVSPSDLSGAFNMVNCSWCHSTQLMDTHLKPVVKLSKTLSCEACHGNTAPNVVKSAIALHQKDCTSCHSGAADAAPAPHPDNQYLPRHAGVFPAFTGITGYPSPDCLKCHNDGRGGVPNLATYHMSIPNKYLGCKSCHDNTTNPAYKTTIVSQSTNCSGCHQNTMENRHVAFHAVDNTISATTAGCLSCHALPDTTNNTLLGVHKKRTTSTVTCDTCHATGARSPVPAAIAANNKACEACHDGGGHQHPVSSFASAPQVDCAQCHTTDTVAKTTDLAQLHSAKNIGCSSCHNPKFEGTVIVKDGTVNVPTCATCHDGTNAPAAEVVYPAHDSTSVTTHSSASSFGNYGLAGNVNCAGCHTTKNIRPVHQTVDCNKCHTSTVTEVRNVITGNWSRQATKVPYSCADCHNQVTTAATTNHKPVHTVSSYTVAANDVENCNTCHNTKVVTDLHVGRVNKAGVTMTCDSCHNSADTKVMTLISQQSRNATPIYSCDSCHTLHGNGDHTATLPVGLTAEPNLKCAQCHDNDPATAGVTDLAAEHTRRVNAATGQNYTCDTCHNSTRTEVKNAIGTKNKNCNACHINGWHNDLTTPHTSQYVANPAFQCSNCHGNVLSDKALHPDAIAGTTTIGGGPVSYKIFRGTDGVSFTEVATSSTNGYSDTGLTANTQYYYQVAAVDQAGNVSTKSNVAFATAAVQQTISTLDPNSAAYSDQSNNGDSSSDGGFKSLSPSALTRLTDGRDSAGGSYDVRVEENGSSDRWIYVLLNQDAKNATQVVLNIRASWRSQDSKGNFLIYPYQSNGTSINTSGVVNYFISNPSYNGRFTTYSVDVTAAAHSMDGFGFMKFRIKPGFEGSVEDAYISEVDYVIISGSATGGSGTLAGDPGTAAITGNGGDSTPPSAPANLAAQGVSASQIDLTWTASTDPAETVNQPGTSNCLKCHDSAQPNILTAITTQKTNCDACHTVHGDPNVLHNTAFVLNPTMPCATCHQSRVDNEHLSRKSPTTGQQYTCDTCHKSADALVQGAIASNNTKCDACHVTRHTNVQSVHVSSYFKDTTVVCENCHTTTKTEFTSATTARHAIPGTTSLAEGGAFVSPWTRTSTTNCRDCHSDTNGTYYGRLLVASYTTTSSNLCFNCHSQSTYTSTNSGSNFAYHAKHYKYGSCQICHSTKPHGQSTQKHFIVLKGQANAATNNTLTKFIHRTGGYSKSDCSAGCAPGKHP